MNDVKRYILPLFDGEKEVVLAADYDALAKEFERVNESMNALDELTDVQASRIAELEGLLREAAGALVFAEQELPLVNRIDAALSGQQQQGESEWPKEQCPTTGAIHDVYPADLPTAADEREAFEIWCASEGYPNCKAKGFEHLDGYTSRKTFERWECWKAARAALIPDVVDMSEQDGSAAQKSFWAGFEAASIYPLQSNIREAWNIFKVSEQFARLNRCRCSIKL